MSLNEALEQGLRSVPGCQTVCYIDLPTGLILGSAALRPRPQEALDRIATAAAYLVESNGLSAISDQMRQSDAASVPNPAAVRQFFVHGPSTLRFFVQAKNEPEHVLCYVCDLSADPERVAQMAMENRQHVANEF